MDKSGVAPANLEYPEPRTPAEAIKLIDRACSDALKVLRQCGQSEAEALPAVAGRALKNACIALFLGGRTNYEIRRLFKTSIPVLRAQFEEELKQAVEQSQRRIVRPGEPH